MGKPYASELEQLARTYTWARKAPVESMTQALLGCGSDSLLSIGSGGSLTAASFAASLHEQFTGNLAKSVTPLEAVSAMSKLRATAVLMITAGGSNPDVIGAFKRIVAEEPPRLIVICSRLKSPLARLVADHSYVNLSEFAIPSGKDGFLATNSLLAFMVMLFRAYSEAFPMSETLPLTFSELVHPKRASREFFAELRRNCTELLERETLIVLYGPSAKAVALDIESKFTEAALGAVQLADYRNFAHGRHHWLAKRKATTGVVALITRDDRSLAEKTLRHIPATVPILRLETEHEGPTADVALVVSALHLVKFAGQARGIDPGRPGVPTFGRKIYNLRAFSERATHRSIPASEAVAIERKAGASLESLTRKEELEFWRNAYRSFIGQFRDLSFGAVVFDYDGTLCDGRDRYTGMNNSIASHLERLLKSGVILGVATGRGKSVKEDLRRKLGRHWWSQVYIGYYNGADVGLLDDDERPDRTADVCNALLPIAQVLQADSGIARLGECTYRRMQITVEPKTVTSDNEVWGAIQRLVYESGATGASAVRSSHSIDILAPGVTKRDLVRLIEQGIAREAADLRVLCIGDRGRFPGNDFDLLRAPHSLSVEEVSSDPDTCWNLAPAGVRGVQATHYYLQKLILASSGTRFCYRP